MTRPGERRGWRDLLRGTRQIHEEIDEELAFHLAMRISELERKGMAPAEAREEALRLFGDLEETRLVCFKSDRRKEQRMNRSEHLGQILQDLRHGTRQLRRRPLFATAAILTLALGIGATTVIFSAADHVLLRPLPYASSDRIVTLWEGDRLSGESDGVSPGNFMDWQERASSFEAIALAEPFSFDLADEGPPEALQAWLVTEGFLEALGVRPVLGRGFTPEEYLPGGPSAVLLSHALWERRFGSDPSIVGGTIRLDGVSTVVAGVLPPWLEYPDRSELYAPKRFVEADANDRRSSYMYALARLRGGVSLEEADAEMSRIAVELSSEFPLTNANATVEVVPLGERILGEVRPAILILLGAAGFLLLIACANVGGLLLARGAEREREFAMRGALGAGRARIARQLTTESLLLALSGGAAGLALAWIGVQVVEGLLPPELPRAREIAIDARVLGFVAAISIATSLLFGLAPTLRFSRPDLNAAMRGGSFTSAGRGRSRLRSGLVVGQIGLTLVLLIGAGLLMRSFVRLLDNDPGFGTENRVALQLFLWDNNPTAEQRVQRVEQLTEQFRALPGVVDVGIVSALPLHPSPITQRTVLRREGEPEPAPGDERRVYSATVSPGYFRVMDIPFRSGRPFSDRDRADAPAVALINESLARTLFPEEDPVGRQVVLGQGGDARSREIVGVVGNVRPTALDSEPRGELYIPHAQSGTGNVTFVVRARADPGPLVLELTAQVFEIDPTQTIDNVATLEDLMAATLVQRRFHLVLLGAFSIVALLLSAVGIYGLISYTTNQRMQEIGIRIALGARPRDVLFLVVAQGARLGVPGIALGIAGALFLTRLMEHMLYGVRPDDPLTYGQLALLMLLIALLGALLPARRAVHWNPVAALRAD